MTKGEAGAEAEEAARPDHTEPRARRNSGFSREGGRRKEAPGSFEQERDAAGVHGVPKHRMGSP